MTDETEFDPAKDAINRLKHGFGLDRFPQFDEPPIIAADVRADYGEERFIAAGRIDGAGHVVTFTVRNGRTRIIGFRRAHGKEMRRYELRGKTLGKSGLG